MLRSVEQVRSEFGRYLGRLAEVAWSRDDVVGLVGFGSTAQRERVDEWSDHDFAWVTVPGAQDRYRYGVSEWLPDGDRIALTVVEGHGGVKVIYDDGHVLEFGIGSLEEVISWPGNEADVIVDKTPDGGLRSGIRGAVNRTSGHRLPDAAEATRLILTQVLIGVGRARRGEVQSARELVCSDAIVLFHTAVWARITPEAGVTINQLDPRRRFDRAYPNLGSRLDGLTQHDVEAAGRLLVDLTEEVLAPGWDDFPHAGLAAVRARLGW